MPGHARQADLDAIPVGVQPAEGGRLLCRYCGRWYRSLGHHLRRGHGIDPASYREQFELPATMALMADDLREKTAERGRALIASNQRVRDAFAIDDPANPERRKRQARGVRRKAETEHRAGVQHSKQAVGALLGVLSRSRAEQRRRDNDAIARGRGYRDFTDLLEQTADLTDAGLGALLGWTAAKARWWRNHHGVRSQARTAPARASAERLRAGLDTVAHGVQPQRNGSLRCLICGRWMQDLSQHITGTHKTTTAQYRSTYGLTPDQPLQGHARRHGNTRLASQATAAGHAAGRKKSAATRARWDTTARDHGFADIVAMLHAHTNAELTTLLELGRSVAAKLRDRYLTTATGPGNPPSAAGGPRTP